MVTMNVDENIKKIIEAINGLTAEIYRLEGSLRVFEGFEGGRLTGRPTGRRRDCVEEPRARHRVFARSVHVNLRCIQDGDFVRQRNDSRSNFDDPTVVNAYVGWWNHRGFAQQKKHVAYSR